MVDRSTAVGAMRDRVDVKHFSDDERRARLATRHGLAPSHRYGDVGEATDAMTVWHATEASTVHLALRARMRTVTVDDIDHELYETRTLVKQLAMRRTLFVFARELLPAAWGSAAARAATITHKSAVKSVVSAGIADDAERWIADAANAVLDVLADGRPRTTAQIREIVPALNERVLIGTSGKKWGGSYPIGASIITTVAAQGLIMRATNAGHWRLNKPAWARTDDWLGATPQPWSAADGYAELVRRWLWTFGPGTEADIVWWLGATKSAVRQALADVAAEPVTLDEGETGWVLPGDTVAEATPEPWAALLPTLDPTVMGWRGRRFYLHDHDTPYLFDTNGNAGNTAWWNGRIVGAWVQDEDGIVHVLPRSDLDHDATTALDVEAARLTAWLAGVRIANVYASPQMRQARLP